MSESMHKKSESAYKLDRASLRTRDVFQPFRVRDYQVLGQLVLERRVRPSAPVLVTESPPTPVALLTVQMAYHHVAQGEIEGHPWMVSF